MQGSIPFIKSLTLLFIAIMSITSCSQAQQQGTQAKKPLSSERVLIIYVSRTNNTKAVAEFIHSQVSGTLSALETEIPYPEEYQQMVDQVAAENQSGYLPPLKETTIDPKTYDVIFIGFPTWGMRLPPPIKSYLTQYNFSEKTIIPFNTHAGYGIGSTFDEIKALCPSSNVLTGFSTEGGKEKEGRIYVMKDKKHMEVQSSINQWLGKLGIL